jgi:serine/threonine protein kinase
MANRKSPNFEFIMSYWISGPKSTGSLAPGAMRALSLDNCRLDGRYDIREQIGRGSYAEIFIARDTLASPQSPHNLVVIKALNVFLQDDLDADLERTLVENFQNEAIALDRVRHPNIISRLGHGTAKDLKGTVFHYLVLEYLAGGDLQKASRGRDLSFVQALKYLEQVCAGLDHAHKNGIIHRDIKPQNLLLTKDRETVKIADFGVARITSTADSPITRVGTNVFAPPEHTPSLSDPESDNAEEAYKELTPAADIYSLAKSAYVLVTGESPRSFAGRPIMSLPEALRSEVWAPGFTATLTRATQSNPRNRHQNVSEFWRDLARMQQYAADDGDTPTHVVQRFPATPQPHVARGYTPVAPVMPRFNTSRDLRMKSSAGAGFPSLVVKVGAGASDIVPSNGVSGAIAVPRPDPVLQPENGEGEREVKSVPKRRFFKRFAAFVIFLGVFAGILYGTHAFLRGRGLIPDLRYTFRTQTAVANTDANLRPDPSANGDPIGFITKNSKLKIVDSRNNWYQVDIIEQGRVNPGGPAATRGWINSKLVDLDGKAPDDGR